MRAEEARRMLIRVKRRRKEGFDTWLGCPKTKNDNLKDEKKDSTRSLHSPTYSAWPPHGIHGLDLDFFLALLPLKF
jgi:hypothetical protein